MVSHIRVVLFFIVVTTVPAMVVSDEKGGPPLQARLKVKLEEGGSVPAQSGKIPLELTFFNKVETEQKFTNAEYRMDILNKDGEQVDDVLIVTVELRDIVLKGRSTVDKPGVFIKKDALKAGENYFLVVSVRNLIGHVKFMPK